MLRFFPVETFPPVNQIVGIHHTMTTYTSLLHPSSVDRQEFNDLISYGFRIETLVN